MNRVLIRRVHIARVRHLHDIEITLGLGEDNARHLLLTGKNGSGKTSVLDAMSDYIERLCSVDWPPSRNDCGIDLEFNLEPTRIEQEYRAGNCVFAYFKAQRKFSATVPTSIEKVSFAKRYAIDESPRELFVKYLLDLKMTQALAATGGGGGAARTRSRDGSTASARFCARFTRTQGSRWSSTRRRSSFPS